jgi:exopolysaccharide production protein ExoY
VRNVASKTVSELSKLSANMTAFDLPVHEGGQAAPPLEPILHRERLPKRMPSRSDAGNGSTPSIDSTWARNSRLSIMMHAAGAIDGLASDAGMLPTRGRSSAGAMDGTLKRALDIVVAGSALVLLSPLLLAVSLLILASMGRPVLFPQRRIGFAGKPFACLKFRTMVQDADAALQAYLDNNPEAAHEWRTRQKLQHDPRVTTLGHMLRRSSIDELPQLLSVLRGDMSCVGPRPIVESESVRYGGCWKDYKSVRPGLTGLWQVSGRNRISYERRVALDRYYVRKRSLWLDMLILIKTIPAVLKTDDTA